MKKTFNNQNFNFNENVIEKALTRIFEKMLIPLLCLALGYAVYYRFNLTQQELIESQTPLKSFVIR